MNPICGARKRRLTGRPHICGKPKDHKGNHRCVYPGCEVEWKRKTK